MGHFKVSVDMPNLMKGVPVEVPRVGVIENGSSVVVESERNPFLEEGFEEPQIPSGVKVEVTTATSTVDKPDRIDITGEGGESE